MKRNKKGQFIKGTNGETYQGFGIWYDTFSYPNIWLNNKSIKLHVYIWEQVNGEKPNGYDIHHKDFNKKNYKLDNLSLETYSDHRKIHAGWVRKNGKWMLKRCRTCMQLLPLEKFYPRKGLTPSNHCIKCSSENHKIKLITDKEYREKKRLYLKEYYAKNKKEILRKQKKFRLMKGGDANA